MSDFVVSPNLPEACSALIYGEKYAGILRKHLDSLRIHSILLPDNPDVDKRLSGHADLSVLHTGGEKLYLAPYLKGSGFASQLADCGAQIVYPKITQETAYPADAQLNLCAVGNRVICNPGTASAEIVEYLTIIKGNKRVPVRQGYSRCAVCVVDADSIVTSDRGIAAAAAADGMKVLLICPGYICLDGFSYGLIGGASFKLSSDRLAFTGRLDAHPDAGAILSFLAERGVEPVYLTEEPVFDIGSAVPILEN